jgi:hypothetical protein
VSDRGVRTAIIMGLLPIAIGVLYFVLNKAGGTENTIDLAGVTMLISLGLAMAFGFMVILKGARDL